MDVTLFGFDSAWADNPKQPGAICAVHLLAGGAHDFVEPALVTFDGALDFVRKEQGRSPLNLVAVDQPLVVPNHTRGRPVERIAASLISFAGGGVQPSNRGKSNMFGDQAPIWRFLDRLGATQDPIAARTAQVGTFVMEVYPALALAALNPVFAKRKGAPKYNPSNRKKFRLEDWQAVASLAAETAQRKGLSAIERWSLETRDMASPLKADQDKLDSVLCLLIAHLWLLGPPNASAMLGDLKTGYMITPISDLTWPRLSAGIDRNSL
jgi:predicted RNase H-like nuclease